MIREACDDGLPIVLRDDLRADSEALLAMAERVAQELSIQNASEDVAIPLDIVYQ
jgi:hypothetical protein